MSIFRRKTAQPAEQPATGMLCQERGCASYNAKQCGYHDRRGRGCAATFCPEHAVVVDRIAYCRRHAGTMRALGNRGQARGGLPDIDNRGPSLVNHVAGELDDAIHALLLSVARPDERVLGETEVTMAFDAERNPRWERSWKLVESTGVVIKVTVFVDDREDSRVHVRVGSDVIAEGVPPWIAHRLRGESVSATLDQSERRLFYRFLEENITASVNHLRDRVDHPSWV